MGVGVGLRLAQRQRRVVAHRRRLDGRRMPKQPGLQIGEWQPGDFFRQPGGKFASQRSLREAGGLQSLRRLPRIGDGDRLGLGKLLQPSAIGALGDKRRRHAVIVTKRGLEHLGATGVQHSPMLRPSRIPRRPHALRLRVCRQTDRSRDRLDLGLVPGDVGLKPTALDAELVDFAKFDLDLPAAGADMLDGG